MDLGGGKYAAFEEEWLLDGSPSQPYRRVAGLKRSDIATGSGGATIGVTQQLAVFPLPVQAGDVFSFISFLVAVAGATLAHSWVALYNGTTAGAALLAQVADNTTATGWAVGANKLQLASAVSNIGTQGIPQGPSTPALVPAGPAVWGVAVYQSGTTLNKFDGMPGGNAGAGLVAVTGQAPMVSQSAGLGAIATAPAVLPALTPGNGAVPYGVLSRS